MPCRESIYIPVEHGSGLVKLYVISPFIQDNFSKQTSYKQYLQISHSCVYLLDSTRKYEILTRSLICVPSRKHAKKYIPWFSRSKNPQIFYLENSSDSKEHIAD